MLRVKCSETDGTLTMVIEGRFVASFAEDVKLLVTRCKVLPKLLVDLSEVTFVDAVGEAVLSWLGGIGARFVAQNSYALDVCERLQLPLIRSNGSSPLAR